MLLFDSQDFFDHLLLVKKQNNKKKKPMDANQSVLFMCSAVCAEKVNIV